MYVSLSQRFLPLYHTPVDLDEGKELHPFTKIRYSFPLLPSFSHPSTLIAFRLSRTFSPSKSRRHETRSRLKLPVTRCAWAWQDGEHLFWTKNRHSASSSNVVDHRYEHQAFFLTEQHLLRSIHIGFDVGSKKKALPVRTSITKSIFWAVFTWVSNQPLVW